MHTAVDLVHTAVDPSVCKQPVINNSAKLHSEYVDILKSNPSFFDIL